MSRTVAGLGPADSRLQIRDLGSFGARRLKCLARLSPNPYLYAQPMKLYLIDGTDELFRVLLRGAEARGIADGWARMGCRARHCGRIDTATAPRSSEVTHVAAAFDSVIESFRNDVYPPDTRRGRGSPKTSSSSFPSRSGQSGLFGVTVWPMYEYETDDALATAAFRWADDVEQVVVMSP